MTYINNIKSRIPTSIKDPIKRSFNLYKFIAGKLDVSSYRAFTCFLRTMPDFLIIGGQKCGTTALYRYLGNHPNIVPAFYKEPHYFSTNFGQGVAWYKAFFPTLIIKRISAFWGHSLVSGEATPYYFFYPHTPKRVSQIVPQIKIILLLRNPVDRAYSHYNHNVRKDLEALTFEEAIEIESDRLYGEIEKIQENENYLSYNHLHFSYLSRGKYIEQLEAWMQHFSEEQMLILKTEDFKDETRAVLNRVFTFLGLPERSLNTSRKFNVHSYQPMDTKTREYLTNYFSSHNKSLADRLGTNIDW